MKRSATRGARSRKVAEAEAVTGVTAGFWLVFLILLSAVCASALGVVYSTHRNRALLNELQGLENTRNRLQVEWGQLLLEQSSLITQGRLEEVAMSQLGMSPPSPDSMVIVIQR